MLPKDKWLAQRNVVGSWPCHGRPITIYADNGMSFKSRMLLRTCREYGVNLRFRPLRNPHFGAHIEAFNKTIARYIHELKGSTFFDVKHKAEYRSEDHASYTLEEFERWLTETILQYHETFHSGISSSPISKYNEAYVLSRDSLPTAQPEKFTDEERLRIDFLPFVEQTIQQYGVQLFKMRYSHPILSPFVNARIAGSKSNKAKFRFHYDPRDISRVYFFHPKLLRYVAITNHDVTNPRMSLWEWKLAAAELRETGLAKIDERAIVDRVKKRRAIESEADRKTKAARRNVERRRTAAIVTPPLTVLAAVPLRVAEADADRSRPMRPYAVEDF